MVIFIIHVLGYFLKVDKNMKKIYFRGEESARFTRFALEVLQCKVQEIDAIIEGREPLTSRYVKIQGKLTGAKLDGYRRHIEITEKGSNMIYWIAGTNATRSIAAQRIEFQLSDVDFAQLKVICQKQNKYIPGLIDSPDILGEKWYIIDNAPQNIDIDNLYRLLDLLNPDEDHDIIREAILDLRSFADVVAIDKTLQTVCEKKIIDILPIVQERDCRIALVELIGYVGSNNLVETLGNILLDTTEDCHVVWAAAIAIGRLASEVTVDYLCRAYDNFLEEEGAVCESCAVADTDWVRAAVLLGLARHADEKNRETLEPYFLKELDGSNQVLRRYACLGLSKFNMLSTEALTDLVECLGDTSVPISVQGFVALALISNLDCYDNTVKEKIANYLENYIIIADEMRVEPEIIWGLEYLAELAALLEIHNVAAKFHLQLSELFNDWRRNYYKAIYFYEKGDSAVLQGLHTEALQCFCEATTEIAKIKLKNGESKAIVNFRNDIINVRVTLQRIIISWLQSFLQDEIIDLKSRLEKEVISIYKRYRYSIDSSLDDKKLSERETKYITGTISILEIVTLFMQLDIECRNIEISLNNIENLVEQICESLNAIKPFVIESKGSKHFVDIAMESVEQINVTLQKNNNDVGYNKLRASRALVSEIKGLISKTTWPMPARACPLGGLGKGTINIKREEILGEGTESRPFVFSRNSTVVINLLVTIEEMAPGGLALAFVEGSFGNKQSEKVPIHIVEGSTTVSFILPEILSSQVATKIDFILKFESRDIFQESDRLSIYAKKE